MKKARFILCAALVSVSLYAVLDMTLAWACKDLCAALWTRDHRLKFRVRNDIYHHTLAPGVSVIDRWGDHYYPLATNNLGFRDSRPRHVDLRRAGRRVLFIGDSFTEGQGVSWQESFVGRIAARLSAQNIDVLNAGVASYAPAVYYAKIRHFIEDRGLSVQRVFVFIDISDMQNTANQYLLTDDHRVLGRFDVPKPDPYYTRRVGQWLKQNTITVAFIYKLRDFLAYRVKKAKLSDVYGGRDHAIDRERLIKATENNADSRWCFPQEKGAPRLAFDVPESVALAHRQMTALHEFLTQRGIDLSVAIYPWPANILHGGRGLACEAVWQSWATSRGVDLINLFDVFMVGPDPMDTIRRHFIPYDVHWSPEGHKLVADVILRRMRAAPLLSGKD